MGWRIVNETIFSSVDTLGTWLPAMVMDGLSADAAQNIGVSMEQQVS
jgi:hypothetical protein